jgi:integrase
LRRYLHSALAENTWRTYQAQWRLFAHWCEQRGCTALPAAPESVAEYVAERALAGAAPASLGVTLAALRFGHVTAGLSFAVDDPLLAMAMRGIRRQHVRPQKQAQALTGDLLREILARSGNGVRDVRDGALLAMLYIFALRPSDAVALDWREAGGGRGWLRIGGDRAEIVLLGSKASPGKSERAVIPTADNPMAVDVITRWIVLARIKAGEPLLRGLNRGGGISADRLHSGSIASVVRRAIARHLQGLGLSREEAMAEARHFSGHSARVGFYIAASEAGVPPQHVAALARHAGLAMARRYARQADLLKCAPHRTPGVGV